jgi:sialic acid synthase SpsE
MMRLTEFLSSYRSNELRDPYLIAEIGVNHEGNMDLAKRLIDDAVEGGAQAVKFQTYKADTIASKNSPSYWDLNEEPTTSQHELFQKYDKFWKTEYEELKKYCDQVGIEFMSTAFDAASAHFLNDLMDVFKISSSDLTNTPFIELQCSFGKPIILSTGASYLWEITQAVEAIEKHGNQLCLMHCVLNYPTPDEHANLGMIKGLIDHFPQVVPGYSDHTLPGDMDNLISSVLLGAVVIEKHFTHDKTLPGNDHYHAMDKEDLKRFWDKWNNMKSILGGYKVTALESEELARQNARRSLVLAKEIKQGEVLTEEYLTWKRPASGISPKELKKVLGKKAVRNIDEDEVLYWNLLES